MMKYHVWTEGCQMNLADSQRLAAALEKLGCAATERAESADIIVLNTCVVRQSAEDKAIGRLMSLRPLKEERPDLILGLMGCMVGVKDPDRLRDAFPFVDVFMPPSDPQPLVRLLLERDGSQADLGRGLDQIETEARYQLQDADFVLPGPQRGQLVSAHVPVVYGCNHVCAFCIIPYRRGKERSRSIGEIAAEVRGLVVQGVKEVTLLGQIVDRYGYDVPDGPRLADLLRVLHEVEGLERIRFLTSHPNYMNDAILDAVAGLQKVCEHIEVPVQAGDDDILKRMRRGYTVDDYRALISKIRARIPNVSIATDVIVGYPGEAEAQFMGTYNLLKELRLDVAHVACYSPRPGTAAAKLPDDVSPGEKERRRQAIDDLQADIVGEINSKYLGQTVEILVEEKVKGKWKGRSRTNKIVFFADGADWRGRLANVRVTWAGPWSMQGEVEGESRGGYLS